MVINPNPLQRCLLMLMGERQRDHFSILPEGLAPIRNFQTMGQPADHIHDHRLIPASSMVQISNSSMVIIYRYPVESGY
jgi:hypothetical protein